MLPLHYHELMGKINKHVGKRYLMADTDTDDKLLDDITLKNVVILMTSFIKVDDKFYPKYF